MKKRILIVLLAAFSIAGSGATRDTLPAVEKQKIQSLIAAVENLSDATFIRNGKSYKPETAGKFLRGKWREREDEVRSAEEFIENVATRSSTTNQPYRIRLANGDEITTASFLRAELAKLGVR